MKRVLIILFLSLVITANAQNEGTRSSKFQAKSWESIGFGISHTVYQYEGLFGQVQGYMMIGKLELGVGFGYQESEKENIVSRSFDDEIGIHHYVSVDSYLSPGVSS